VHDLIARVVKHRIQQNLAKAATKVRNGQAAGRRNPRDR
jgi:hypothetical protein